MKEEIACEGISGQDISMPLGLRVKLSAMMFLQFMTLPVWFNTIIPYVKTLPGGEPWTVWCGMFIGFGTLASPLVGMFADRFLNAEKVLALTHLVYAALLSACFFVRSPALLFALLLIACFVNMPGWSLTATIAMTHSTPAAFPHIRVFGTLGWIASGVFSFVGIRWFGRADFDTSPWIFAGASATAVVAAGLAFLLPPTPPRARGTPISLVDAFGLKAFSLFRNPRFLAFGLLLAATMIPFQWYMNYNALYLRESGFTYLTLTQNLGQVGELAFMLALPFLLRACGYKWSMVIGIALLAARYACFYGSVRLGCPALDFGGILLHGAVFGLIIVNAQMYATEVAPPELRNQAQGLTMTLTGSVGVFLSVTIFNAVLAANARPDGTHDWATPYLLAFGMSAALAILTAILFRPAAYRQGSNRQPAGPSGK